MGTLRAAGIAGFGPVVTELGGDPVEYLRRVGLGPDVLIDEDIPVDDGLVTDLLELAATELNQPDLGLLIANRHGFNMLGPVALLVLNATTVAEAFALIGRYLTFHAPDIKVTISADPRGRPEVVALTYQATRGGPPAVHLTDAGMGFIHRSLISLFGPEYGLIEVDLPYKPVGGVGPYQDFYGVEVREARKEARLYLPLKLLQAKIAGADRTVRDATRARLDEVLAGSTEDMTSRVRGLMQATMGVAEVDIEDIAKFLAMHPRTLQRRLDEEGTVFSRLLDDARRRRAHWELTQTDTPVAQVAKNLGFGHQSTLSRAAIRWWGTTPLKIRRQHRELVTKS